MRDLRNSFNIRVFLALILTSCTSLLPDPLSEQELRFRPGFEGLTYNVCVDFAGFDCLRQKTTEYRFDDPTQIKRLRDLKFVCKVGEEQFHICADQDALCSSEEVEKTFLGITYNTTLVTEVLKPPKDLVRLLDAGTYCAAQGSVSEKSMF